MIIVNPNHKNPSPWAAIEPPIWCAYFAAYYDADGASANEILDAEAENLSDEETIARIGTNDVVFVAMGANPSASSTPKMGVIERLTNSTAFTIMVSMKSHAVGLHPAAMGCSKMPPVEMLAKLRPRWDLVDFSLYRAHNWHCLHDLDSRGNYGVVYSSFGCLFDCYYCNIHTLYKGITYRNPQDVVDEIGYLVSRGIRNLKFCDEMFTLNKKHIHAICEGIKEYNLNIWAYARADTVTPEMLKEMKAAGFNWLAYGFESILLDKGNPAKAVAMTRDAGINVLGNFLFGLPGDDMTTMQATLDLAKELQCEWVNFYCAMAYPGSKLWEVTPDEDKPKRWEDYDQYSPSTKPLPTDYLRSEEVLAFRDKAFKEYFSNKGYQQMIKEKFGQPAIEHINDMLQWNCRRSDGDSNGTYIQG